MPATLFSLNLLNCVKEGALILKKVSVLRFHSVRTWTVIYTLVPQTKILKAPKVQVADGCYTYKKKQNVPNNVIGDEGLTMAKHTHVGVLNMIQQQIKEKKMKITLESS